MTNLLFEKPPEGFDISIPDQFLKARHPMTTMYNPTDNQIISEAKKFEMNWVLVWALMYVATEHFRSAAASDGKNFLALTNPDGKPQHFRVYGEGVEAAVQTLAALYGKKIVEPIIWPGTQKIIDAKATPFTTIADLDKQFGAGFAAKVDASYADLDKFFVTGKSDPDALPNPIEISPHDGTPAEPVQPSRPDPVKEVKPEDGQKSGGNFFTTAFKWIGIIAGLGGILWVVGLFSPGVAAFLVPIVKVASSIYEWAKPFFNK